MVGRSFRVAIATLSLIAALPCSRALAAPPSLEAFTGVIGGPGGGDIASGCTTFGGAPQESFFSSSIGLSIPIGGIAACGDQGDLRDVTETVGPVESVQHLDPVLLGNPGFAGTYEGDAHATADYRTLGASARER